MKKMLKRMNSLMVLFGFDLGKTVDSIRGLPRYFRDLSHLKTQQNSAKKILPYVARSGCSIIPA